MSQVPPTCLKCTVMHHYKLWIGWLLLWLLSWSRPLLLAWLLLLQWLLLLLVESANAFAIRGALAATVAALATTETGMHLHVSPTETPIGNTATVSISTVFSSALALTGHSWVSRTSRHLTLDCINKFSSMKWWWFFAVHTMNVYSRAVSARCEVQQS